MNSPDPHMLQESLHATVPDGAMHAPGRDAIAHTLDLLYKGRKPRHFESANPISLGGDEPLAAISVWQRAEPVPHWHYVTYGLTDLFDKQSTSAASGFGFELTFRLHAPARSAEPPLWPMHLLQSLARYVVRTRNGFHDGHRMSANGPITLGTPTSLCSMAFTFDAELPAIDTPNGKVAFLQVVGLTLDEEAVAHKWDTRKLLSTMLPFMPLFITELSRESLLSEPDIMLQATNGIRKDGSSSTGAFTDLLDIAEQKRFLRKPLVQITLGARQIEQLNEFLPLRLPFGKSFTLSGPRTRLVFELGSRNAVHAQRDGTVLFQATADSVKEFATLLHPRQGVYKLPSFQRVLWDVKPTTIRNAEGDVVEVVG